jgi:predicted nucleic acid-binding protein
VAVLDANFLIDLDRGTQGAGRVLQRMQAEGSPLFVPASAALEFSVGARDPALAWARVRDAFTVVSFTDDLAEEATPYAARLRSKGRWPGWPDFLVAATAWTYDEPLVSSDARAFETLPGIRWIGY